MKNHRKQIKRLMKEKGISQKELAEEMGVSESTMSKWLSGKRIPNIDDVATIADILDCEVKLVPESVKCGWCDDVEKKRLRFEYYLIDDEGCTVSYKRPHIVQTGIAEFCPNCGRKLDA